MWWTTPEQRARRQRAAAPPVPPEPAETPASLAERLLRLVARNCGNAVCQDFEPGGKKFGVGIASPLYCTHCGHARDWHDVAAAAAIVARHEDIAAAPLFGGALAAGVAPELVEGNRRETSQEAGNAE